MHAGPQLTTAKSSPGTDAPDAALVDAILKTVAYADIFDYPLTVDEIHRYLIGFAVSRDSVVAALDHVCTENGLLVSRDGFVMLPGHENLAKLRQDRQRRAKDYWRHALRYGRIISSMPFVRMVSVTGELAMDNVREESDIDFFVVTEHRRLWLCRLLIVAIVKAARLTGDVVCPNFLLSERVLSLPERDLYTAHEVVQMVPLSGLEIYARFRQANRWVYDFLPNAVSTPQDQRARPHGRPARALAESALRTPVGEFIERWERRRKLRRFALDSLQHAEASFSDDWCKGHVHDHGQLILAAFDAHTIEREGIAQ